MIETFPTTCIVCDHLLGEDDPDISSEIIRGCSNFHFYFRSYHGVTIDEYAVLLQYKNKNYRLFSCKSSDSWPDTTVIEINGFDVFEKFEFVPFENRMEFFNKIMSIESFL